MMLANTVNENNTIVNCTGKWKYYGITLYSLMHLSKFSRPKSGKTITRAPWKKLIK